MTKGGAAFPFRFDITDDEQQVPPLRFAPVGMTLLFVLGGLRRRIRERRGAHRRSLGFARDDKGEVALPFKFDIADDELQILPLRFAFQCRRAIASAGVTDPRRCQ